MKIAVTARGSGPDSPVDERFGRAYWILVYDDASGSWEALDKAAQAVAGRGAGAVLTGVTGPKAYRALHAAGIAVYHGATGTAASALEQWREGRLARAGLQDAAGRP